MRCSLLKQFQPDVRDLARLGQVRLQRIVGGIFWMMGMKASFRTVHRLARSDHRSVQIQGHDTKRSTSPCFESHVTEELSKTLTKPATDVLQPARERSLRRQDMKSTETTKDRITPEKIEMSESGSAQQNHPDRHQRHPERAGQAQTRGLPERWRSAASGLLRARGL